MSDYSEPFSFFISFMSLDKQLLLKEEISLLKKSLEKKGETLRNFRSSMSDDALLAGKHEIVEDALVLGKDYIVFDLTFGCFTFHKCDMQIIPKNDGAIMNIGLNQGELFASKLFEFTSKTTFILGIMLEFCRQDRYKMAIAAFEDSITSCNFSEFAPGTFNAFTREHMPDFLSTVKPWIASDDVCIFTNRQLYETKKTETEMADSILQAIRT